MPPRNNRITAAELRSARVGKVGMDVLDTILDHALHTATRGGTSLVVGDYFTSGPGRFGLAERDGRWSDVYDELESLGYSVELHPDRFIIHWAQEGEE